MQRGSSEGCHCHATALTPPLPLAFFSGEMQSFILNALVHLSLFVGWLI